MILLRSRSSALFILLVLFAGFWAFATVKLNTQFLPILPSVLPSVRGLTDFARLAGGKDEIYLVADPDISELRRGAILERLKPALSALPDVQSAEIPEQTFLNAPGTLAAWIVLHSPTEVFQRLVSGLNRERIRQRLEHIPEQLGGVLDPAELFRLQLDPAGLLESLGANSEINERFQFAGGGAPSFLIITPAQAHGGTERDCALLDKLEAILDTNLAPEDRAHVLLTGNSVFNAQISRQMRGDVHVMVFSGLILLAAAFYGFYRTLAPLPWIFFFQILTVLCGVITARLLFGELNVISIGFASILLGVGMDYCILVYHHFASPHRADAKVWRTLRRGIWFSAAITASSFFLLAFSRFPGLQQMAVLVGVGLFTTALCATWLLKMVLEANPPTAPPVLFSASQGLAKWVHRNRSLLLASTTVGLLAFALYRPWNRADSFYNQNLETLQPSGISAFKGHRWLEKLNPSASDTLFVLRGSSHDALRNAASLVTESVSSTPEAKSLWMIPSESNREANLAAWKPSFSTMLREAFNDAGLGEEWSRNTLQFADALDAAGSRGESAFESLSGLLRTLSGRDTEGAYAILRISSVSDPLKPAEELSGLYPGVEVRPVSWVSLRSEVSGLAKAEFYSLGVAMLLSVILLCWFAQRSFRLVALNLLALVLSMSLFGGLLLITGTAMTALTFVSIPLLVGLVIDFSLHLLMTLEDQHGDLGHTFDHLAAPMLLTGLSSSIGFGAPMLTGQPAMQNFGLVMDLGILSAVASSLLLMPPFYSLLTKSVDYRDRLFYKFLYNATGFEIIKVGWRILGAQPVRFIARMIGLGYALTHRKTVSAVRENLALFNPGKATFLSACRLFMNQAESLTNYGRLSLSSPAAVLEMVGESAGFEYLRKALEKENGCLLVSGHLGFFEFGGLFMSEMGFPITAITLPEPTSRLTQWRADFRKKWNIETIVIGDDTFSILDVARAIQSRRFVAILADRPYDQNTVPVEMPNGTIPFSTGPALIALLAKCPIIPVGVVRQKDGKFRVVAADFIEPQWLPEGRAATLEHYTRQIAQSLLPLFQEDPEQWFHFARLDVPRNG